MVSALAMQRLESALHGNGPTQCQVLARLEQAARASRERAAHRTLTGRSESVSRPDTGYRFIEDEPGLPTKPQARVLLHAAGNAPAPPNPRFHTSGIANRV